MLKNPSTAKKTWSKFTAILEAVIFCLLLSVAILDGLANLSLNQDSSTYMIVAHRILISGRLESLVNSTNFDSAPGYSAYVSQPPGYPFLLVPFMAVLRDPMLSALAAQVVFIVLFYLAVYLLALKLKFRPLLRVVALLLFTFVAPFLYVHRRISTETIFITLSIAAAIVAVGLLTKPNRNRDWVLFGLLVALSSMVRYTGLANLAMIAPVLLKWDTFRAAWRLITHRYTLLGVLVIGGLIITLSWMSELRPGARPGLSPLQVRGILLGVAAMVAGAAGLVLIRVRWLKRAASSAAESSGRQVSLWPLITILACLVPTLVWFARNKLFFGGISPANNLLGSYFGNKLWDPVVYVWNDLLSVGGILRPVLALFFIFCLILPFLHIQGLDLAGYRKTSQIVLLSAAGGHLVLLWFLSLVTKIEPIRWRLFSPILAFAILGMLNGVQHASESIRLRRWNLVVAVTPLVFLLLSGPFSITDFLHSAGQVNYPVERQLWNEINKIDWTHSSSYFYSDFAYGSDGYLHQIFSNKLQGLLWDQNAVRNPIIIQHILSDGINPFLVVTENGPDAVILDKMVMRGSLSLEKITFQDTGFVLYFLPRE
jgi:hypothetical protein